MERKYLLQKRLLFLILLYGNPQFFNTFRGNPRLVGVVVGIGAFPELLRVGKPERQVLLLLFRQRIDCSVCPQNLRSKLRVPLVLLHDFP